MRLRRVRSTVDGNVVGLPYLSQVVPTLIVSRAGLFWPNGSNSSGHSANREALGGARSSRPTADGLLAATAVRHELILATRNVKDVVRTGAQLVNPLGDYTR